MSATSGTAWSTPGRSRSRAAGRSKASCCGVPSDAPPLGELKLVVGEGPTARRATALVSFSRSWVVTNYDNLLALLRYFPWGMDKLNALRNAKPADRPRLWREFWTATDPVPRHPENEALDQYFTRVAIANERFKDEGGAGWRTDRGEVYVTLGEPDQAVETPAGQRYPGRAVALQQLPRGDHLHRAARVLPAPHDARPRGRNSPARGRR